MRNPDPYSFFMVVYRKPLADTPAGEDDVKAGTASRRDEATSKASDCLWARRAMDRRHDTPASVVQDGADAGVHGDSRVFGHADLLLFMSLQLSSPESGPDWRGKGDASAAVPQASAEDTTPCGDRQALAPAPLSSFFLFSLRFSPSRGQALPL